MEKILQKTSAMNAPSNPALPRRTYTAPSLTIVQFQTEHGFQSTMKITSVLRESSWSDGGSDGTEAYETANRGSDFF